MKKMKLEDILKRRDYFIDYWQRAHAIYREDFEFSLGEQIPDKLKNRRGWKMDTWNVTNALILPVVNGILQSPPGITVYPSTESANKDTAQSLAGLIRAIEYKSTAKAAYASALDQAMRGGLGTWREVAREVNGDTLIVAERIDDPTTVYFDPDAKLPDYSDAHELFHMQIMQSVEFEKTFPKAAQDSQFKDDNEYHENAVTVWEYYFLDDSDGVVTLDHYLFNAYEILSYELNQPLHRIPYHLITGQRAWIDDHVEYYGITHWCMPAQRAINYFLSEALNRFANHPKSPLVTEKGVMDNQIDAWQRSLTDPDFALEVEAGKLGGWKLMDPAPDVTPYLNFATQMVDFMRLCTSIYPDASQKDVIAQSGEAIKQAMSQAGLGTYHIVDSMKIQLKGCGDVYLDFIAAYWYDDAIRPARNVDGSTKMISVGPTTLRGNVVNIDYYYGDFGVTISDGVSYASQKDAARAELKELIQQGAEWSTALLVYYLQLTPVAGLEEAGNIIKMYLPQNIQDYLNVVGDGQLSPTEQVQSLAQALAQLKQEDAQNKDLLQKADDLVGKLKQENTMRSQDTDRQERMEQLQILSKEKMHTEDNQLKLQLADQDAQIKLLQEAIKAIQDEKKQEADLNRDVTMQQLNSGMQPQPIMSGTDVTIGNAQTEG